MTMQDLQSRFVALLTSLPAPVLSLLAGRPTRLDNQTLDPEVQLVLRLMRLTGAPALEDLDPVEGRAVFRELAGSLAGPERALAKVEGRTIIGPDGEIPVRIYTPRVPASSHPVIVYYHGGGWVIGDLESHDRPLRVLADDAAAIVVSVDYRLAPENRFPAAYDDAVCAAQWVFSHATSFGGDPTRVAVAGDSAGGNLAAAVAQALHHLDGPAPVLQWLLYPVTDLADESPSYETFADGFFLTRKAMRSFIAHYTGGDSAAAADPRASPLRAESVAGLAPALIQTAGFDPLRDEGRAYAERLLEAGVSVDYRNYPGQLHGFFGMSGAISGAAAATAEAVVVLRRSLHAHE